MHYARMSDRQAYKALRIALLEARAASGMTQSAVAAMLNRQQSFVSKYESGERSLDVVEFVAICRILGAKPSDIMEKIEVEL